jgi:hypothetical protein
MRYELNDCEWNFIQPRLPNKPRGIPRASTTGGSPSSSLHQSVSGCALMSPRPKRDTDWNATGQGLTIDCNGNRILSHGRMPRSLGHSRL